MRITNNMENKTEEISNSLNRSMVMIIEHRDKNGKLKKQWQDNFVWRYLQRKTKMDIRIPLITGHRTYFYKHNI